MKNNIIEEIPKRTCQFGIKKCSIYIFRPGTPKTINLEELVLILENVISIGSVCFIEGEFTDYTSSIDEKKLVEKESMFIRSFSASISNCLVVSLTPPFLKEFESIAEKGILVAPKNLGVYICSLLGLVLTGSNHSFSIERSSIAEINSFKHLWSSSYSYWELIDKSKEAPWLFMFMVGLGEFLGKMHSLRILHGDVHTSNFILREDNNKVVTVDVATVEFLLRDLTSNECAADISMLMPELSSISWCWFKMGYTNKRGEQGHFVINLIEHGDEWRNLVYYNSGKYEQAIAVLLDKLESRKAKGEGYEDILNNLGACYSKMGLYMDALKAYQETKNLLSPKDKTMLILCDHNIAMNYFRMTYYNDAIPLFESVLSDHKAALSASQSMFVTCLYYLSESYAKVDRIGDAIKTLDMLIAYAEDQGLPEQETYKKRCLELKSLIK